MERGGSDFCIQEAQSSTSPGGRKHLHSPRSSGGICPAGDAVFHWQGLFGDVALGAKSFFPRENPVSFAARGHQLQISRDDRISRFLCERNRRRADRPPEPRSAWARGKSLCTRDPEMLRIAEDQGATGRAGGGRL